MKKFLKLVIIDIMLFVVLCNISVAASVVKYDEDAFSISLPKEYTETDENIFSKESGETIVIQVEKYADNVIESEIYTDEFLKQVVNDLETSIDTPINVSDYKIKNFINTDYKCFWIKGTMNYENVITFFVDNYLIYTQEYVITLQCLSLEESYFNNIEYNEILKSFKINDEKLPTEYSSYMMFENYISNPLLLLFNLLVTIVLYCFVPVILRIKNGKYEYEKGRKIVLINSIVVCLGVMFYQISRNLEATSGAAAIFYYYINKSILLKKKDENKESTKNNINNEKHEDKEIVIDNNISKTDDIDLQEDNRIECIFCGNELSGVTGNICVDCKGKYNIIKQSLLSDSSKNILIKDMKNLSEDDIRNIINKSLNDVEKKCPKCNSKIMEEDKFCTRCGENLKKDTLKKAYCTNCGKKIEENWKFCKHCGFDLNEME